MKNLCIKKRVLKAMEHLIDESTQKIIATPKFKKLHVTLLKKNYNAINVEIDYLQNQLTMDLIIDDKVYSIKDNGVDRALETASFHYKDLGVLLKTCLDTDRKNLCFYANLLRTYSQQDIVLSIA